MKYKEVAVVVDPSWNEVLMAEFSAAGYDSFWEEESGFRAYTDAKNFDDEWLLHLRKRYSEQVSISYTFANLEEKNWNEEWEKNFSPVSIDNLLYIRATFHQSPEGYQTEVIIDPKMSFGTGHHATTEQMCRLLLHSEVKGLNVLDAGCGTGILAILACKLGASKVTAYDTDDWCIYNAKENRELNDCPAILLLQGAASNMPFAGNTDLMLANINRNVLMEEMPFYARFLKVGGELLLSGFYEEDIADILGKAESYGFKLLSQTVQDRWAAMKLKKCG